MSLHIFGCPLWAWLLIILGESLAIWATGYLAEQRGRLNGLSEADRRNAGQQKTEFARGKIEGVRECADWLRHNGHADESKCLLRLLAPSTSL